VARARGERGRPVGDRTGAEVRLGRQPGSRQGRQCGDGKKPAPAADVGVTGGFAACHGEREHRWAWPDGAKGLLEIAGQCGIAHSEDRWVKRVKTASHQGALFGLGRRLVQTSRPCKTTGWGAMVESEERRRR
jgi:hypothetical protein